MTREYLRALTRGKWGEVDYKNAGIEGYGWGTLSIYLLIHHILGLQEETVDRITISPALPRALRRQGASYRVESLPWGKHLLNVECIVKGERQYKIRVRWRARPTKDSLVNTPDSMLPREEAQQEEWEAQWGEKRSLNLLPV